MVKFKFLKPNGIGSVGSVMQIPTYQADLLERLGLGERVLDSKPKETKTKVKKDK